MGDGTGVLQPSVPFRIAGDVRGNAWLPYLAITATVLALSCAMVTVTGTIAGATAQMLGALVAIIAISRR